MTKLVPIVASVAFVAGACTSATEPWTDPSEREGASVEAGEGEALVAAVIAAHGADRLGDASVDFAFRGTPYRMTRREGRFRYERWPRPGQHEVLTNDGFVVRVDGEPAKLSRGAAASKRRSLNSVVYFASLPYPLADPAVRPEAAGRQAIGDARFEALEVRFAAEDGGDDHEDGFRYWVDPETRQIAFMAYRFERGDGGVRFRVRTGASTVGGVTFLDWSNHGRADPEVPLERLPDLWMQGKLPALSTVALDDIRMTAPRFDGRAPEGVTVE